MRGAARLLTAVTAVALAVGCSASDDARTPATSVPRVSAVTSAPTSTSAPTAAARGPLVGAACAPGDDPDARFTATEVPVGESPLREVSGVAPGVDGTWVIQDSGNPAALHRIDRRGLVATVVVDGARNVDWEDLARVGGDDPHLWIADTGDNRRRRSTVTLYRVPEPAVGATRVAASRLVVELPSGAVDVEALAAGRDGLFLITKEAEHAEVLRVPADGRGTVRAASIGRLRLDSSLAFVTGAALTPDGSALLVQSVFGPTLHPLEPPHAVAASLSVAPCPLAGEAALTQEAIGVLPDGSGYVTIAEGGRPVLTTFRPRPG